MVAGRYDLMREIGRGVTGHVYIAWDRHLEREVAVKVLDPSVANEPEIVSRFDLEIRYTSRLNHPGIVNVFEAAETEEGMLCYVMTLARGQGLDKRLDQLRQSPDHWRELSLVDRLTLFLKLLEVLSYAHSQGIVHRDLKPANIMVGNFGEVWVLDWGLARSLREETSPKLEEAYEEIFDESRPSIEKATIIMGDKLARGVTPGAAEAPAQEQPTERRTLSRVAPPPLSQRAARPMPGMPEAGASTQKLARSTQYGQILGSPAYMSPEQARGLANEADQRTDIYSLGVILFELLTLHTPCEARPHEKLQELLERVRRGDRTLISEHWPEVPQALKVISEWALASDPQDRYPDCEVFAQELRTLLSQLSASYSELERQRLAKEREAQWLPVGLWDFGAATDLGPFTLPSSALRAEQVGQVHHPELGGMLLGGYGMQLYPLDARVGDDVRITLNLDLVKGDEFWVFVRGTPPNQAYQFRFGAFQGKWLSICRGEGDEGSLTPNSLTMRPLRDRDTTTSRHHDRRHATKRLVIEAVGSRLVFTVDDQPPLVVRDLHPLSSSSGRTHLALATWKSQVLVRQLMIERRRSPLMVPAYAIGNELLRQGLHRQAIEFYRSYLQEHQDAAESIEAEFMLCMALGQGGQIAEAEQEIRSFLTAHIEHPLAQDAMFELACLHLNHSPGRVRRAVQEILSYQESGDFVRTRFCLWLMRWLNEDVDGRGITPELEQDLKTLRSLIRGSPDESTLLSTLSYSLSEALRTFLNRLVDSEDAAGLRLARESIDRLRVIGYRLTIREQRLQADYVSLASHLEKVNDPAETVMRIGRGEDTPSLLFDFVRDFLALINLGCGEHLLAALAGEEITPVERLLRAGLYLRYGQREQANADLQWCFRLTDVLETERTSLVVLLAARLGCFGLGFLPWELVEDGLKPVSDTFHGKSLEAIAAWIAECLGHTATAAKMYRALLPAGTGLSTIGRQGLERLGLSGDGSGSVAITPA